MKTKYGWKFQPKGNVSAQIAGEYIEKISKENKGGVTAEILLKKSRNKTAPLHNCFEWDDSIAAEKYRLQEAQQIIVQLVVVEDVNKKEPIKVRAFPSVEENDSTHYTTISRAMSSPMLRQQIIEKAWLELQAWQNKYMDLKEFAKVFDAINVIKKRRKAG